MTVRVRRSPHPRLQASLLASALLLGSLWATPAPVLARPAPAQTAALQAEAERLAAQLPGDVGAALVHLESGRAVYLNADQPLPMASTMKVPVAVHILKLVDEGKLGLQQ
jgi:beta-lactamase class A